MKRVPTRQRTAAVRFAATLAAAHIAMAAFMVMLIYQVGTVLADYVSRPVALAMLSVVVVIAVAVDLRAAWKRSYSFGLKRQTAKSLAHRDGQPWWITPLFWGLDTGFIGSTFRVSATSWVLLVGAFLNVFPQWSGMVYGIFFGVPLLIEVLKGEREFRPPPSVRIIQTIGVMMMAMLPLALMFGQSALA